MNSQERVSLALNLEEPDRVPLFTPGFDGNLADEALNKPAANTFNILNQVMEKNPEGWKEELNRIMPQLEVLTFSKVIEAASILGFDACSAGYIPLIMRNEEEMIDIFGKRQKIKNINGNVYPDYFGGLIKDRKDWESYPKPDFKEIYRNAKKFFSSLLRHVKKINNDIVVVAQDSLASIFPPAWQGMGITYFARALKRDPQLIKERLEFNTEFALTVFKAYKECGATIFMEGGDIAHSGGPFLSPKQFNKFLLPCYQQVAQEIHDWNGKYILHTDGDINLLLDFIVNSGFDGLQCLELPFVNPKHVKKKIGDKICLIGNIDTKYVLVEASREEVQEAVKSAIKAMGKGGGFMLSPSNLHPKMSLERIKWMVEAGLSYGKYPLNL